MDKNVKTIIIIGSIVVGIFFILPLVLGLIYGGQGFGYEMMGPGMMGGYGAMFFMPILWIVIIAGIIWAVVAAVRRPGESDITSRSVESALEVLKRRYARGEIDKAEYEAKKKDII
ncbi:MAG: SHOCT domain-containing protein [Dehalococcoidia bacterium]|nr:SHOCT domain-containing protein [Dehalococcoidia bacterium]MDZ4246549.1 SHOCT domain-containing protein [Dehalococcoidia bacterium]